MAMTPEELEKLMSDDVSDAAIDIEEIAPLVDALIAAKEKVAELDAALKEAKQVVRKLETVDIPNAMLELGLSEIKTADGAKVSVVPFVDGGFVRGNENEAIGWLEENGFDDIVKASVSVAIDRGELEKAREVADKIASELGVEPAVKETVHPQTLKAFLRRCDEDGVDLPDDLFRVYRGSVAKVSTVK